MEDCLDLFNNNHYPMSTYHTAMLWKTSTKAARKALKLEIDPKTNVQENKFEETLAC